MLTQLKAFVAVPELVTSLLHSVWQGAIIAGLLFVVLGVLSPERVNQRYALSLVAFVADCVSVLLNYALLNNQPQPTAGSSVETTATAYAATPPPGSVNLPSGRQLANAAPPSGPS